MMEGIVKEVKGLYFIVEMKLLRKTPGVVFDLYPLETIEHIDAIDRVLHEKDAVSPGPVGDVMRPWYMHEHQVDHLIVLHGQRTVHLYTRDHGKVEEFVVTPHRIMQNGGILFDGSGVLCWPTHVFHRIVSGETGSASINLATHYKGFDVRHNFSIYDLDTTSGSYRVIRKGFEDQFRL